MRVLTEGEMKEAIKAVAISGDVYHADGILEYVTALRTEILLQAEAQMFIKRALFYD